MYPYGNSVRQKVKLLTQKTCTDKVDALIVNLSYAVDNDCIVVL